MSQSRFSIVLVGVSALLRRPLVSRLRPAGFTARGSGGFRRSGRPSASGLPLGELAFGFTTSDFRHAPLRGCRSVGWPSGSRLPLFGTHRFGVALGGLAFGLTASAFRHAPLRGCPRRVGSAAFRFGDCRWAGWPSGSRLPLFGTHRFGVAAGRVGSSAFRFRFRHAPLRGCHSAGWPSGSQLPLFGMRRFGVAAGRVDLRAHGFRFSARTETALPRRRSEGRRSAPTRHLFHFKTLIPTC